MVKTGFLLGCFAAFFAGTPLWAQRALDAYVIIDGSSAMDKGGPEAVSWVCGTVIDEILKEGDRLTVWTAGESVRLLYSAAVSADTKDEAKKLIRGIVFQGSSADYKGALTEARTKILAGTGKNLNWTILVSGANPRDPPVLEAESAGLLMYSRVENFSGWRVLTVGLDISGKVRESVFSYMKNR